MFKRNKCIDCGKTLGKLSYYTKAKRCRSHAIIEAWRLGKMDSLKVGKFGRRSKKLKCLLCNKSFMTYQHTIQKFCCLSHAYIYRSKNNYLKTKKLLHKVNNDFISWFTGFWEGEGCIITQGRWYCLTLAQKDLKIMKIIKSTFKFGKISKHSCSEGSYTWNLYDCGSIGALIEKMSPYIKLQHRKQQIKKFFNRSKLKELKKYVN